MSKNNQYCFDDLATEKIYKVLVDGIDVGKIFTKSKLFSKFFKMIGVDEDIANIDAGGIEYHLDPQT
jgi:hypothetical protein